MILRACPASRSTAHRPLRGNGPLRLARARPRTYFRRGDLGDFPFAGVPRPVLDSGSGRAPPRAPCRARPSPLQPRVRSRILRRSLAPGLCGSLCSRVADGLCPGAGSPFGRRAGARPRSRDSTGSIPHSHTQPEGPGRVGGPRALHGVPGSDRANDRPEPYLVTVETPPHPSSDWGILTRYAREDWPSRPSPTCATTGVWQPLIGS